eukprot:gnl/TRDRNA2_/TRDRNA2_83445_c0_seq1.p1 gnl/TRDRNA2_/TRDRNA2_83445_c0~~gnl/TRDRNA2_/TRDRNA2_83445_c0_seq1.p1  ORF type:complete len:284 (+),score=26.31 gnl/TRDRNA2_/TRDRNA2_83445_c0_seq1:90-941(+)
MLMERHPVRFPAALCPPFLAILLFYIRNLRSRSAGINMVKVLNAYHMTSWEDHLYSARAQSHDRGNYNGMAASGWFSNPECNQLHIMFLQRWLEEHNVTSFVEAPAGHWRSGFQRHVHWPDLSYTGVDRNPDVIGSDREFVKEAGVFGRLKADSMRFLEWDILKDPLPLADVLFVRNLMIHFTNEDVKHFLNLSVTVCPARFKYVIFDEAFHRHAPNNYVENNEIMDIGMRPGGMTWRDMSAEPFNLPTQTLMAEDVGKACADPIGDMGEWLLRMELLELTDC